jgi:hypothetical protein
LAVRWRVDGHGAIWRQGILQKSWSEIGSPGLRWLWCHKRSKSQDSCPSHVSKDREVMILAYIGIKEADHESGMLICEGGSKKRKPRRNIKV